MDLPSGPGETKDDEGKAEIEVFFTGGGKALERGAPVPLSDYSPKDWGKMLHDHNGYNVLIPETLSAPSARN